MSAALSPDAPHSKTWWSLPSRRSNQDLPTSDKSSSRRKSSGLKVIATAIGFKSKKPPVSPAQSSPHLATLPRISTRPNVDDVYLDRSSSSTRTRVDSLEPPTPLDGQREGRQSLFTFSDADPFATRGLSSPLSPTHLSVYSNPSNLDLHAEPPPIFRRVSYTSSRRSSDLGPVSPSDLAPQKLQPRSTPLPPVISLTNIIHRKYVASLHRKQPQVGPPELPSENIEDISHSKSTPFAIFHDQTRSNQPVLSQTLRPHVRPRGMTDSGLKQRPRFLSNDAMPFNASTLSAPRAITRQPSIPRTGAPPTAPPMLDLPSPPHQNRSRNTAVTGLISAFASSSCTSFTSGCSTEVRCNPPHGARKMDNKEPNESKDVSPTSLQTPPASRSLKKAISQQSLAKSTNNSIPPSPTQSTPDKPPRNRRMFHPPKLSVPLPSRNTNAPTSSMHTNDSSPIAEQRRGSAGLISLPGRKRLFSGSSSYRPSTSHSVLSDEDTRSVFSIRSESHQTVASSIFKPWIRPASPTPSPTSMVSPWQETPSEHLPSTPSIITEYTPQPILSPDEMAEFEASVEESHPPSFTDGDDEPFFGDLALKPPSLKSRSDDRPTMSSSLTNGSLFSPSTSQANMAVPFITASTLSNPSSPQVMMTSLPPPPRQPRTTPIFVTSPGTDDSYGMISLPPPPRQHATLQIPVDKAFQRRSVIRKPSFLEIDDDSENGDTDLEDGGETMGGSFLDLARESFDTTRHE